MPDKTQSETVSKDWLDIISFAPLNTIGAENYLRYGIDGPRHYVMGLSEHVVPTPDTITVQVELIRPDDDVLFGGLTVMLKRSEHRPDERTVWQAYDKITHTQWVWAWDFFRMLSQLRLRVKHSPDKAHGIWAELLTATQKLAVGDHITLHVESKSGQMTQHHMLETPPLFS